MLAIQYLEHSPELENLDVELVRSRLQDALTRLPLDTIILGWSVPPALVDACAGEASKARARLYRWQPLLAGCAPVVDPGWRVMGANGEPVPAYQNMPEFSFLCPNNEPAVQSILEHFAGALHSSPYQGVFLDRIRFPSPAPDPLCYLGCFCEACQQAAAQEGLDLVSVRGVIQDLGRSHKGRKYILSRLLSGRHATPGIETQDLLARFLAFRGRSIGRFVERAADIARTSGLKVGLDCFSPALARMVGQDLGALDSSCDWIKIMTYGHSLAPAGLPYELLGLAEWLAPGGPGSMNWGLQSISQVLKRSLPSSCDALCQQGIGSAELALEVKQARQAGATTLLAGIELVDLLGVTSLSDAQIRSDLRAFRQAGSDGLVLSWDLWRIPPDRLDLVREVWLEESD